MQMPLRIGIVACEAAKIAAHYPTVAEPDLVPTELPFTPDDQLLVDALRNRGHLVAPVIWGERPEDLKNRFDLLIVRSPWDYMETAENREKFAGWLTELDRLSVPTANDPKMMLWLLDKRYLRDFESCGIRIVPTRFVETGSSLELCAHFLENGPLIVKPSVSASGMGLVRVQSRADAESLQPSIDQGTMRGEVFLVQPFIESIQDYGEWSLIYLAGRYSHAILKKPARGAVLCQADHGGSLEFAAAPTELTTFGDQVIAKLPLAFRAEQRIELPLYLRIDLLLTPEGLALSECEGVEPELFLRAQPGSAELLCNALDSFRR
jgi:hypothetical protein